MIFNSGGTITREDIIYCLDSESPSPLGEIHSLSIKAMEKRLILSAIDKYGNTLAGKETAAKELGISLTCLYDKFKKYKYGFNLDEIIEIKPGKSAVKDRYVPLF